MTALGIGFFLSAMNVRYRDVRYMIPVFLQVLPLLSGVMYAVESIPEKWQWILSFNPMTAVISGWRWAVRRRTGARLGPGRARASRSPSCSSSSVSECSARRSRASRTRSDGRSRSRRRASRSGTGSVSSRPPTERSGSRSCTPAGFSPGKEHKLETQELWALDDVSFDVPGGRGARRHRPERRRQVDAAQGAHADHHADERAGRDPRPRGQPARGRNGLPSRAHRAREHLPERRDPRDEAPRDPAEAPRNGRVLRASRGSSTRR